ncbi:TonB-dependent receptor [Helicobacter fennelliae]|uniref:TonB-dependent receptor n=2 Tax=Helicobacter TaxID=209 RepID=T1CZD5_9HELI|nr:TonB-dependent receptor [Helicobacter fennelliae]GAD19300.1 TonB-dependent receptor [Helicobacter fennelliae MRY12-0050]STP08353.1 TonB-dependent receptor protein [Helicobacter fennelliae]
MFKIHKLHLLVILASGVLCAEDTYMLQNSVVTGSAMATDIAKIPGNISVVDSAHISHLPNQKITDTIKKLAGVMMYRDVGFNPRPAIKIRGINYGTLVMLDGVILNDLEGENRILNQISLYDVTRVEVARGAFSSLYGTNAIGGVVNFITSMPTKLEVQALAGYGSEFVSDTADKNLYRFYGSVGDAFFDKRLRLKISGGFTSTQGYPSFPTYPNSAGEYTPSVLSNLSGWYTDAQGRQIIGDGGKRKYNTWDIRAKAEFDLTESSTISAMFSASNHNYDFHDFKSYLRNASGDVVYDVGGKDYFVGSGYGGYGSYTNLVGALSFTQDFERSMLKIAFSSANLISWWQDADISNGGNRFGGAGYTQDITTSNNYLDMIYHVDLSDKHRLVSAVQFRYLDLDQSNYNVANWREVKERSGAPYRAYGSKAFVGSTYISWDAAWLESLSTSLGVRYDYWRNFDGYTIGALAASNPLQASEFSPKASINYKILPNWITKASIGSGFRMPTLREAYPPMSHGIWIASQNLKPERGLSFEVGTEFLSKYIKTSLYYFQTELSNMIYRVGNGTAENPRHYSNAGYGRINGIELSAEIPIYGALSLEGSYTLTSAKVIKNDADPRVVGKQLQEVPEHIGNIALHYNQPRGFFGSLWTYLTSSFYDDVLNTPVLSNTFGHHEAQFTLNAKIGYMFNNGIEVSFQALNMTNNRYYDYYIVAGASYYAQLRYVL